MDVYFRCCKNNSGFYDKLIRWYSRSPYTHAEFCWPLQIMRPPSYLGAQTSGGVLIRPSNYLDCPFDTFRVSMRADQAEWLRTFLEDQLGKPYDFRAVAGMAIKALDRGKRDNAWFCSELVYGAFAHVGIQLLREPERRADRITPRDTAISTVAHRCCVGFDETEVVGPTECLKTSRSPHERLMFGAGER